MEARFHRTLSKDIVKNKLFPMLSLADKYSLVHASQSLHQFFKKTFKEVYENQLLRHIIYGELVEAEALIADHPNCLLAKGIAKLDHTNQAYKGTALQIALYIKDPEMVAMIQRHLSLDEINNQ
jgi:hypothetical protein